MDKYQQGDVLFYRVCRLPDGLRALPHTRIAEGEATGHYHEAVGPDAALLEPPTAPRFEEPGKRYLNAPSGATIRHQEHRSITLPPGVYEVRRVREYDHFQATAYEHED